MLTIRKTSAVAAVALGVLAFPGGAAAHHTPCKGGIAVVLQDGALPEVRVGPLTWVCDNGIYIERRPAAQSAPPATRVAATPSEPATRPAKRCKRAKSARRKGSKSARRCARARRGR